MKTIAMSLLLAGLPSGLPALNAQDLGPGDDKTLAESAPAEGVTSATSAVPDDRPNGDMDAVSAPSGGAGLRLDFKDAPLDRVLDYLSDAAGFIIIKEVNPRGNVTVVSHQPMTKAEAVQLLNTVLHKNGYGVIANERFLTIVSLTGINTRAIPVKLWDGDPESIPRLDTVVTMVLPIRFVAVNELLQNILPLVSPSTPLTANQSGNSLIMTDTQASIRRIAELIQAVDSGAEDATEARVFKLKYASSQDIAQELTTLFADDSKSTSGGGIQVPVTMPGGRPGNPAASGTTGAGQTRMMRRNRLVAVPDPRTSSVVVTASRDAMPYVEQMVLALDNEAGEANNQVLSIIPLEYCEPAEALQVLQEIFGATSSRTTSSGSTNPLIARASTGAGSSGTRSRSGTTSGFGTTGSRGSSPTGLTGLGGGGMSGGF